MSAETNLNKPPPVRYRELAASLGVADRVRFLGLQPEPARFYAASDLFVLPTRFDAFGMVVLEAMATGIPAVVTAAAGAVQVIEHGVTGARVADAKDAAELATACSSFRKCTTLPFHFSRLMRAVCAL